MLYDPRFWLYLTILFFSAFLFRGALWILTRKKGALAAVFASCALACLSLFWIVFDVPAFTGTKDLAVFILSAVIPGFLTGASPFLIAMIPLLAMAFSMYLGIPLADALESKEVFLGRLSFYPSPENSVYFEWDSPDQFFSGTLQGKHIAVILEKQEVPGAFFFLKSRWTTRGFTSENKPVPVLLGQESSSTYMLLSDLNSDVRGRAYLVISYPALIFHKSGFFDSYSYFVNLENELIIISGKTVH